MARRLGRLKAAEIGRLGPDNHDGGGLYLSVGKGSAWSWIFRFRRDGKLHDLRARAAPFGQPCGGAATRL